MIKKRFFIFLERRIYRTILICYGLILIPFTSFLIFIGIKLDGFLGLPELISKPYNWILFALFALTGLAIVWWAYSYLAIEGGGSFSPYFGKMRKLVKTGPYSIIRHPSIIGKLFGVMSLGFLFQSFSFMFIIIPILFISSLAEKILREEKLLKKIWKEEYIEYKKSVPMIIPRSRRIMKKIIVILLIVVIGATFRFYNLDKYSLWYDEAYGVLQAKVPNEVFAKGDNTAPLYIFFIHFWQRLTDSVFGLRLPSVIFGLASVLMAYFLGKRLFNEKIAFVSAFLLAISPFHIFYSQEARMYSLMTLLTLLSVYFLMKYFYSEKKLFLSGYIVFNLLNIYCHYIGLFIWLAQVIFVFLMCNKCEKQFKKIWGISNLIILLLFLPWVIFLLIWMKKAFNPDYFCSPFWPSKPSLIAIFMTFKNFSLGYNVSWIVYISAMSMFFLLFLKGIFSKKNKKGIILCLLCLFVPILSFFAISKIGSVYVDRYFIAGSVFYYYIVAAGLVSFNKKISVSICIVILVLSLFSLKNYYGNLLPYLPEERVGVQRKKDHQGVAQYIANEIKEGDIVCHTCRNTIFPFIYHFNKVSDVSSDNYRGSCLSMLDKGRLRVFEFNVFGQRKEVSKELLFGSFKRIWLIFSTWNFDNFEPESGELVTVKFMNKNYRNIGYKGFKGAIVYSYEIGSD